jgi:hypothetical protein
VNVTADRAPADFVHETFDFVVPCFAAAIMAAAAIATLAI